MAMIDLTTAASPIGYTGYWGDCLRPLPFSLAGPRTGLTFPQRSPEIELRVSVPDPLSCLMVGIGASVRGSYLDSERKVNPGL